MNNKITVIHPILTKEEYERRMQMIKKATAVFLMEVENERKGNKDS